jgi:HD-GYP domain-containing protein (c-di-GMP phosphodiesterase class II)
MGHNNRKVAVDRLKLGMFVSALDRPWLQTPFPFQGFVISSHEELRQVEGLCKYVCIDPERGEGADVYLDDDDAAQSQVALESLANNAPAPIYRDLVPVREELEFARQYHERACNLLADFMKSAQSGKELHLHVIDEVVQNVVESVVRNPDAFMWLTKLKKKDSYTYSHSIDVCALATAFGRHLGLPREQLGVIAQGALSFDVGKMRLPSSLLSRPRKLDVAEFELVKRHVEFGVSMLQRSKGVSKDVIAMTLTHHERYNGTGYPRGLRDEKIPFYGRIAAIVDCYDAITSDRPYSRAMSPHAAVRKLYEWRNVEFQDELVESFIQCLGVYPTGTLVELSTGEIGIITAQNRIRRLRPTIMLVLDKDKKALESYPTRDLTVDTEDVHGNPLDIVRAVDPSEFNIDPAEFYL